MAGRHVESDEHSRLSLSFSPKLDSSESSDGVLSATLNVLCALCAPRLSEIACE